MTEIGNDTQLKQVGDEDRVIAGVLLERYRIKVEEARVSEMAPAEDEPGEGYPDPDEPPRARAG